MIKSPFSQPEYVTNNDFAEFRGEMRNFRFEFGDFKEEMHIFKDDMQAFRSETNARFDAIDGRLSSHDGRFDGIDKRLDTLTRSLSDFREEVPSHNTLLRNGLRDDIAIVFDKMKFLDEKIDKNHNELVDMVNSLKR
jgi:hypothetical protein